TSTRTATARTPSVRSPGRVRRSSSRGDPDAGRPPIRSGAAGFLVSGRVEIPAQDRRRRGNISGRERPVTRPLIRWLDEPEKHDYPAAQSFLELCYPRAEAKNLTQKLRKAGRSEFKAKDIFRASGLSLLGISNSHVEKDRRKIAAGVPLSPLLLVRD